MSVLVLLTTLTFVMPTTFEDGSPLPLQSYVGVRAYNRLGAVVAVTTALPGEEVVLDLGANYCGRFTAAAYWIPTGDEGPHSDPVVKPCGCQGLCHE